MQHHAIDITALGRSRVDNARPAENSLAVEGLQLFYNEDVQGIYRPQRLRQVEFAALF